MLHPLSYLRTRTLMKRLIGGDLMLVAILVVIACYLIGSIPFPLVVSKLIKGIDLRQHGSGNMGATNAARVLGKRWFPVVFGLDAAKGLLTTFLAMQFLPETTGMGPTSAAALGGLAAVVGHCFPIYVGFRGGVGLAASAGALALIAPPWLLLTVGASILIFWFLTRNMHVGVAASALCFPFLAWYFGLKTLDGVVISTVWAVIVIGVHLRDIKRWIARRSLEQ